MMDPVTTVVPSTIVPQPKLHCILKFNADNLQFQNSLLITIACGYSASQHAILILPYPFFLLVHSRGITAVTMSTVSPVMGTSPTSQKRTHDEANATDIAIKQPTSPMNAAASSILTPVSTTPSRASTAEPQDRSRQSSPAASSVLSSAPTSTSNANANPCSDAGAPPAKKRKLTFAEREVEKAVKRREKEEKERQKAEEKSRKEEEKRKRDEEKRQKQEEKEEEKRQKELEKAEKQKAKDAEKHAKEDKKRKDDEEKQKKERVSHYPC